MAGTFRCDGDARAAARDLLAELAPLEFNSKLAVDAVLVARAVRALVRGFAPCRFGRDADQSPQERAHLRRTSRDIRGSEGKVHRHVGFSSMTWPFSSRSLCFCRVSLAASLVALARVANFFLHLVPKRCVRDAKF